MIWQEAVIAVGQAAFFMLLMPTLLNPRAAVPRATSLPTGLILGAFAFTFATMGLAFAAGTSAASALGWLGIAVIRTPKGA